MPRWTRQAASSRDSEPDASLKLWQKGGWGLGRGRLQRPLPRSSPEPPPARGANPEAGERRREMLELLEPKRLRAAGAECAHPDCVCARPAGADRAPLPLEEPSAGPALHPESQSSLPPLPVTDRRCRCGLGGRPPDARCGGS